MGIIAKLTGKQWEKLVHTWNKIPACRVRYQLMLTLGEHELELVKMMPRGWLGEQIRTELGKNFTRDNVDFFAAVKRISKEK